MTTTSSPQSKRTLPAEWHRQSCVQLTWPHEGTDWKPLLPEVTECYVRLAAEILRRESLIVVSPEPSAVLKLLRQRLPEALLQGITTLQIPTDDTWARDHAFISVIDEQGSLRLLDFRFNGWGQKFPSSLDNLICRRMAEKGVPQGRYESQQDFVLEGGSIESDGKGTLLTTSRCLLSPNRNEPLGKEAIELRLKRSLGAERVLWLEHGALEGDDTDGHIDTLARFCPCDTIAYVQCLDPRDPHFPELSLMEQELRALRTPSGKPYRLIPLPMALPEHDKEGNRLPATYANFLAVNGAVLLPSYGHAPQDEAAQLALQEAFPGREIVQVNARILLEQHGSLHCSAMQFPSLS